MRSKKECFDLLKQMRDQGKPDEELKTDEIIEEIGVSVLVRKCLLYNYGQGYLPLISYEIWTSKEYYLKNDYGDCNNIHCTNISTDNEEGVISDFRKMMKGA